MCWFASMQGKWFASMQGNGLQWSPYTSPPSHEKEEATALAASGMQLQEAEGSCSSKDVAAGDGWAAALRQAIGWTGRSAVLTMWLRRTRDSASPSRSSVAAS